MTESNLSTGADDDGDRLYIIFMKVHKYEKTGLNKAEKI